MNHLRKLGLASFFLLGLGLLSGASATGWTPQTAAIALICYCIGLILALLAFMQSRRVGTASGAGTRCGLSGELPVTYCFAHVLLVFA